MTKNFDDRYEVQQTEEGATLIKRRQDYVCDTKDEIGQIKTGGLLMGSTALAVRASALYALDSEGSWYNVKDPDDIIQGGGGGELSITITPSSIEFKNGEVGNATIVVNGTIPEDYELHMQIDSEEEAYSFISDQETDYVEIQSNGTGTTDYLLATIDDGMGGVLTSTRAQIIVTE